MKGSVIDLGNRNREEAKARAPVVPALPVVQARTLNVESFAQAGQVGGQTLNIRGRMTADPFSVQLFQPVDIVCERGGFVYSVKATLIIGFNLGKTAEGNDIVECLWGGGQYECSPAGGGEVTPAGAVPA